MVSFFGLKFGSDKKYAPTCPLILDLPPPNQLLCRKSDKGKAAEKTPAKTPAKTSEAAPAQNGPKKWDQNQMGEGQFFGTSVGNRTVVNGSIRSVNMSRPGTASSSRISPYNHNTHALAASSMYDLSNVSHVRQSSSNSLKPAASDTNLRTKFNNASMTNLKVPGPGFGSRPGTPGGGKAKAWVNPLDVHFGRSTPSALPTAPRSPLAQYEIGADDDGENSSVFGDKAENIADTIMSSVVQKEQEKADKEREEKGKVVEREREEREARLKAQEEEKKREVERQKEQERHRAAAAAAAIRAPHHGPPGQPSPPNSTNRPMNGQMDRPIFQGRHDQRPSSRNGHRNSPGPMDRPVFQGHGDHRPGSRNGSRPLPPPGQGPMNHGPFQGQVDYRPSSRSGQHDQRPRFQGQTDQRPGSRNGPHDRPHFQGHIDQRPRSRNGPQDRLVFQGQMDQRPGSRNGPQDRPVFQGQIDQRPGSRNGPRRDGTPPYGHPPHGYPNRHMNGRPANGPGPMNGQGPMRGPAPMNGHPRSPKIGPNGPLNGRVNSPQGSSFSLPMGSPNGGPRAPGMNGSPRNGSPMNGPNRPSPNLSNIQTGYFPGDLPSPTVSTPRSSDEEGAPAEPADRPVIRDVTARRDTITSTTPKRPSVSMAIDAFEKSLVDGELAAEESLRDSTASSAYSVDEIIESPVQPAPAPRPSPPYAASQPQRSASGTGRPFPGKGVQRPNPEEYGVVPTGRMTPAAVNSPPQSPPARLDSSSPPSQRLEHASLQPAPLFQQPKWTKEDEDFRHDDFSAPRPVPSPKLATPDTSSALDFGATPPTPDPTNPNWPLAPPASSPPVSSPPSSTTAPQLQRPNAPPPLNFDFSPNAFSRDHGALTPPAKTLSQRSPSSDTLRPSTAGGGVEIGMARGPSMRRPNHGLQTPTGIADRFGTPLI
ncbi:hypothetical protein CONLIGDRAFT_669152 [Coniochaeta ligniaria NRRL 30616]|uniref:Uncharacterized protein n=1 Tax=Coniochaeta ligniaria NRRL 30616 TaxID=1408157 RepID=A0A1J7JPV8_9PEZI|nr:hypothetical protein CONLIGDRAFT_669152 [Coniochaeta ligniaria NRRL 30616]